MGSDARTGPLTRIAEPVIGPAKGRTRWRSDLSPHAGRGTTMLHKDVSMP
jgi:hypothetical protein